jgi:hypothetical protein
MAHQIAKNNLLGGKARRKEHYDSGMESLDLSVGDKVLLYDEMVRRGRSRKLSAQWIGLYEEVALNKVNVTIKRGKGKQTVHINRVNKYIRKRMRRGVFNFIREVSKILFGTMDNEDLECYNEQI